MRTLIVSDREFLISSVKEKFVDKSRIDVEEFICKSPSDSDFIAESLTKFRTIIIAYTTIQKSINAAIALNANIKNAHLITLVDPSQSIDEKASLEILKRVSGNVIVSSELSDFSENSLRSILLRIYEELYTTIERDVKLLPKEDLSGEELLILYCLQQGIVDNQTLVNRTGKTVSQLNRIFGGIAIKMNVPNNRTNIVCAAFRAYGEIQKLQSGFVTAGLVRKSRSVS